MNLEAKIKSLTKKEAATLFLICCGQVNKDISEALKEDVKTTSSRITKIYKKLEVPGEDDEKRINLWRDYCPMVKKVIPNFEVLRTWTPVYPTQEIKLAT